MSGRVVSAVKIKNTLLVSIPEEPEDDDVAELQDRVLGLMQKHQAKAVILDISTVDILDSFFARTIIETSQMITLMGGRTILAGMQPSVAITAVQLGLVFDMIETCMDVDSALALTAQVV